MEYRQKSSINYIPPWVSSELKVLLQPSLKLSLGSKVSFGELMQRVFKQIQLRSDARYIKYNLLLFHQRVNPHLSPSFKN